MTLADKIARVELAARLRKHIATLSFTDQRTAWALIHLL